MDFLSLIGILIVAIILGAIAEMFTKTHLPLGWIGNIIFALIGGVIGQFLLGQWGPQIMGMYLIQTIIGAIIAISLFVWIRNAIAGNRRSAL